MLYILKQIMGNLLLSYEALDRGAARWCNAIKINNKVQLSPMIKSIRMRPLEKPLIIQQTIYNHKEVLSDYNSEASFLKLSENASKQINNSPELDPFQAIEKKIYHLQQQSALKLNQLQQSLTRLEGTVKKRSVEIEKDLIEENKQNLCVAYQRVINPSEDHDNMLECKFQMDENFNYVKDKEYLQSEPSPGSQFYFKKTSSLKNSRQMQEYNDRQPVTKRRSQVRSSSVSCHPRDLDKCQTTRRNSLKKDSVDQKHRQLRSASCEKVGKRGRVYEQILSLYSIPKLLAMEVKMK